MEHLTTKQICKKDCDKFLKSLRRKKGILTKVKNIVGVAIYYATGKDIDDRNI